MVYIFNGYRLLFAYIPEDIKSMFCKNWNISGMYPSFFNQPDNIILQNNKYK